VKLNKDDKVTVKKQVTKAAVEILKAHNIKPYSQATIISVGTANGEEFVLCNFEISHKIVGLPASALEGQKGFDFLDMLNRISHNKSPFGF